MLHPSKMVVVLTLVASSAAVCGQAKANERWLCRFEPLKSGDAPEESIYWIRGSDLVEQSGDVISEYKLVADDAGSLVATKGGSYASDPSPLAFTVMIDKRSGRFSLHTTAIGSPSRSQQGVCQKRSG